MALLAKPKLADDTGWPAIAKVIKKQPYASAPITIPPKIRSTIALIPKICCLASLGFPSITLPVGGSQPRAVMGNNSAMRSMARICSAEIAMGI